MYTLIKTIIEKELSGFRQVSVIIIFAIPFNNKKTTEKLL